MGLPAHALLAFCCIALTLSAANCVLADDLVIESLPANAPEGFDQFFTKYVNVMGVSVWATSNSQDNKVLHCARTLAQFIDNNEDGVPDNAAVLARLVADRAGMVMFRSFSQFENSGFFDTIEDEDLLDSLQDLMANETIPDWREQEEFDASLEECFHLVNFAGYSRVYPSVFGAQHGTEVSDAMDINIANGYFHYNDSTCDYRCKLIEYTYWALTSMLGAQSDAWRVEEIADEWELPTRALVETLDPTIYAILTDPQYALATVLPDADYTPTSDPPCPADINNDGQVNGTDLSLVLGYWNDTTASPSDINGDNIVDGGDLAILLGSWGNCSR